MRRRLPVFCPGGGLILLGFCMLGLTFPLWAEEPPRKTLKAGAAMTNVTPFLDMPIVGGWTSPAATHIHDELWARAIVLDNGQKRLAIVIVDNIGPSRAVYDAAKKMIQEKTGIPPENVMMAGTHTHSSTSGRGNRLFDSDEPFTDYQAFLARRMADAVRVAANNLAPAHIAWGSAEEPTQVFNRRYFMKPGTPTPNPFGGTDQVVMNPGQGNPNILKAAGPTDPQICFLSIRSPEGRPIALLANYGLHYVGPGLSTVISADYFGVFADRIQELLGADRLDPPFVGILSNGASGDINNINWLQKEDRRWAPYERMRFVAHLVAQRVHEALQNVTYHDWVELDAVATDLPIRMRKPTPEQIEYAKNILAKPADAPRYHIHERTYAERVLNLADAPEEANIPLQVFRIGQVGICAMPFEVFCEIGLELKQKSPLPLTFVISHANGHYGYLPTPEQHALGGYETWLGTNRVEIEASVKIVNCLLDMLRKVSGSASGK
ncbi:MAG: neutral/alkaline non-lysosomal ceramidase N-terminal domain-containing protein [Thermoguttaceae bacterium]|nr:neutral/alkaline non-lysosomal ceramidase N-terminal domain-containing protein [Thermoguttaceae bacterium]MDW8079798.1 neutral/alkaline non-lysosomal ceramidase N-terminal domain-containing protein [Thermoguttaceae bacterium]